MDLQWICRIPLPQGSLSRGRAPEPKRNIAVRADEQLQVILQRIAGRACLWSTACLLLTVGFGSIVAAECDQGSRRALQTLGHLGETKQRLTSLWIDKNLPFMIRKLTHSFAP